MADQHHFDPQAWLAEFRAYQAARAEKVYENGEMPPGVQEYVQRAYHRSDGEEHQDKTGLLAKLEELRAPLDKGQAPQPVEQTPEQGY